MGENTISGTGSMMLDSAKTAIARVSVAGLVRKLALGFIKQVFGLTLSLKVENVSSLLLTTEISPLVPKLK